MKVVSIECPNCGAMIHVQNGSKSCVCSYCDKTVWLDDGSININKRFIDEAKVREIELERARHESRERSLQEERRIYKEERARWLKILFVWLGVMAFGFAMAAIFNENDFIGRFFSGIMAAAFLFGGIGVWLSRPREDNIKALFETGRTTQRSMPQESIVYEYYPTDRTGRKNKGIALLLCLFLGYFGAHYFYVGRFGMGILYLFTAGFFFIGWIIDIFRIARGSFRDSRGLELY